MARTPWHCDRAHARDRLSTRASDRMDDARGYPARSVGILERTSRRILGVCRIAPTRRQTIHFVIPRRSRGTCFLRYKQPVSVLVIVYTPDLEVLLIERADYVDHWQSVTGSVELGETLRH